MTAMMSARFGKTSVLSLRRRSAWLSFRTRVAIVLAEVRTSTSEYFEGLSANLSRFDYAEDLMGILLSKSGNFPRQIFDQYSRRREIPRSSSFSQIVASMGEGFEEWCCVENCPARERSSARLAEEARFLEKRSASLENIVFKMNLCYQHPELAADQKILKCYQQPQFMIPYR
jgi:hypothetical protein